MVNARCVEVKEGLPSSQGHTNSKPIVFFDMDGVLTREKSSWNYVHSRLGVDNDLNYSLFRAGKIGYLEFMRRDIYLWIQETGEVSVSQIKDILNEIELFPGVVEATRTLSQGGFYMVIVSGGLMWLAERVGKETGIREVYANIILSLGGKVLPEGRAIVDPKRKDIVINDVISKYKPEYTISVGDSPDDEKMFMATDYSISMNNEPSFVNARGFDLKTENLQDCSDLILGIRDQRNEIS